MPVNAQVQFPASVTYSLSSSKTMTASNATAVVPIFRVTGTVKFLELYGIVTTALGAAHTIASWRINDQGAQVYLTAVGGTTLNAAPVGSMIVKCGLVAAALTLKSSVAGAVLEPTTLETPVCQEFIVTKKDGAVTEIEYRYATTDTPTTGAITFFVEYQPMSADGAVIAV
jgi:hypothetical protein